jgi:hypothetical protein
MMNATGELFMLSKKERILLRTVLEMILTSKTGKEFILRKFGTEYIKTAERLLEDIS